MTQNPFLERHIGPGDTDQRAMLNKLGMTSLEALISQTVPASIRMEGEVSIPDGIGEEAALAELFAKMDKNVAAKAMIGQGYHGTHVPPVIQRNMFENPGWYTAYTPYQPEISQGRLEMLFHFQTLVAELTGLPIANASLLDEATAIAEAAGIAYRHHRQKRQRIVVANKVHPQSLDVLKTRASTIGFTVDDGDIDDTVAAVILQLPDTEGALSNPDAIVEAAKSVNALVIVSADPMSLVLLEAPGSWGADICVGSMQRFGVPLGNGGPHAAYMAASDALTRLVPGRLIGESIDAHGRPAYRLALQTREQHIRREKATSNICTAQALLANMAAAYAIWHGPAGLKAIAERIHGLAARFCNALTASGFSVASGKFFDTITVTSAGNAEAIFNAAEASGYLIRVINADTVSVAFDETSTEADLEVLCDIFGVKIVDAPKSNLTASRNFDSFLSQEIFHSCRSETEMMRLLRKWMDIRCFIPAHRHHFCRCIEFHGARAERDHRSVQRKILIHQLAQKTH
ncbi:MAG: aminomethyl-transferring glycine dehydrogenase subunit GcvPA, partial [Hyphomicrobiales bacterium]